MTSLLAAACSVFCLLHAPEVQLQWAPAQGPVIGYRVVAETPSGVRVGTSDTPVPAWTGELPGHVTVRVRIAALGPDGQEVLGPYLDDATRRDGETVPLGEHWRHVPWWGLGADANGDGIVGAPDYPGWIQSFGGEVVE